MSETEPSSRPQFLVVWMVWAALLVGIVLYGFLGCSLQLPRTGGASGERLALVFTVVGMTALGVTLLLRHYLISAPLQDGRLKLRDPAQFRRYLAAQIVVFALCEAVAILGLVLRMGMGLPRDQFLGFVGAGFLALLIHAPLQARLDEGAQRWP